MSDQRTNTSGNSETDRKPFQYETNLLPESLLKDIYSEDSEEFSDDAGNVNFDNKMSKRPSASTNVSNLSKGIPTATTFSNPPVNNNMLMMNNMEMQFCNMRMNDTFNSDHQNFDSEEMKKPRINSYSHNNLNYTGGFTNLHYFESNYQNNTLNNFNQNFPSNFNGYYSSNNVLHALRMPINPQNNFENGNQTNFGNNSNYNNYNNYNYNSQNHGLNNNFHHIYPNNFGNTLNNQNNPNFNNNFYQDNNYQMLNKNSKMNYKKRGSSGSNPESLSMREIDYNLYNNYSNLNNINNQYLNCNNFNNNNNNQNLINKNQSLYNPMKKTYSTGLDSHLVSNIIAENLIEDSEEDFDCFLERIGTNLIPFIKTQKGSRFFQKFLNKIAPDKIDKLLVNLSKDLKEIMTDNYGNYFMQKLTQGCSSHQRMFVLKNISNSQDFLEIASNGSGTHSIQSLIEIMSLREEEEILKMCVEKHILRLACNSNGTHIIQKIITCLDEASRQYINQFILDNISKMCMNANGICVIKKFITATKSNEIKEKLLKCFENDCINLVEDAFGNYAIQFAMDFYGVDACSNISNIIIRNILLLSNQKFSSNVVEKCIQSANKDVFAIIVNEMFLTANFVSIIKNKYGNFVIQKVILKMNPKEKAEIKQLLGKRVSVNGGKERIKFNSIIELLN